MFRTMRLARLIPLVPCCLALGCLDARDDLLRPDPQASRRTVATIPIDSIDEHPIRLAIARELPGFAGLYFADGNPVVALTDVGRRRDAEAIIRRHVGSHNVSRGIPDREIGAFTARQVQYTFLELAQYKMALRDHVFGIDGVVSLDVGESLNRVKIGLADVTAEVEVRQLLSRIGIPADAVTFWDLPYPSVDSHDLADAQPQGVIQGGWLIRNDNGGGCTLGFAAVRATNGQPVFVTNSHCTVMDHALDGGAFRQPSRIIGHEILDPGTHTCGIIPDPCRNSDAALIAATVPIDLGKIARTTSSSGCESCSMPLTINHTTPTLTITSASGFIAENVTLHKIGQTTGWTHGAVEDVCADYEIEGWVRQCSDRVDYSRGKGDSGSPVFSTAGGGSVVLRGIHFGSVGFPYNDALMSNFGRIQMDLGNLIVAPLRVSITGPTVVTPGVHCSWGVLINNGASPFSYRWSGMFSGSGSRVGGIVTRSGGLSVVVTDNLGREDSDAIDIVVEGDPGPRRCVQ